MTRLLCLLMLIAAPASAQWRAVNVTSTSVTAINENFRRASIYSSRKLDKYYADTVYGLTKFNAGVQFADGTTQTTAFSSTTAANYALLNATQTFTGGAAFSSATSTTTFSGWVDIGAETVPGTPASPVCTASCSAGNRILGGGCQGGTALVQSFPSGNTWTCQVSGTCTAYAICARVK